MLSIRFGNTAGARARLRNADLHHLVSGITSAPAVLSATGRRPAVHPHSAVYETFGAGRCRHESGIRHTRAHMRRSRAPIESPRARVPYMAGRDFLLRQCCARMRKPNTQGVSAALTRHIVYERCHRDVHLPRIHRASRTDPHDPPDTPYGPWTRARDASRSSGQPDSTHGPWTVTARGLGHAWLLVSPGVELLRTMRLHMAPLHETFPNVALSGGFAC